MYCKTARMYLKVARTIPLLVILLMSLEILGCCVTALPAASDRAVTVHQHKTPSSLLGTLLFEKAEEETEKTEEEKDGIARMVLLDFSRVAFSLSFYHTPQVGFATVAFRYDVRPPVHEINCVFLI